MRLFSQQQCVLIHKSDQSVSVRRNTKVQRLACKMGSAVRTEHVCDLLLCFSDLYLLSN